MASLVLLSYSAVEIKLSWSTVAACVSILPWLSTLSTESTTFNYCQRRHTCLIWITWNWLFPPQVRPTCWYKLALKNQIAVGTLPLTLCIAPNSLAFGKWHWRTHYNYKRTAASEKALRYVVGGFVFSRRVHYGGPSTVMFSFLPALHLPAYCYNRGTYLFV